MAPTSPNFPIFKYLELVKYQKSSVNQYDTGEKHHETLNSKNDGIVPFLRSIFLVLHKFLSFDRGQDTG